MEKSALVKLNTYWSDFFEKLNGKELDSIIEGLGEIPPKFKKKFQLEYYPEPFYGYILEDMTNDVLVPLINPGEIKKEDLSLLFESESFEQTITLSNNHIKERHLTWNKDDYLRREKEFLEIIGEKEWRNQRFKQCRNIIGKDIDFMHTIEFFPFHSKKFTINKSEEKWLQEHKYTQLSIDAIEEISKKRLVKHIICIGKVWITILKLYDEKFKLESHEQLYGPNGGIAHTIYKFKPIDSPNALPIVVYSGPSMSLPREERAVNIMRNYLEIN